MSDAHRRTIVIVVPDLGAGGSVSAVAVRQAGELSARHCVILMSRTPPLETLPAVEFVGIHTSKWKWLRRFCHVPRELSFAIAVRQALGRLHERTPIDVVWFHSHSTTAMSAAPLRSLGVQAFMTTHGDIFDRPPGTYAKELAWFYRQVTPAAYRRADRIQVLSPAMRDRAIASGALPAHIRVVPNGIDPAEIGLPANLQARTAGSFLPRQTLRLLYVGSLGYVKGPDVLIRAVAVLRSQNPNGLDVEACFVGGGDATELQELSFQLGLGESIRFLGPRPRTALGALYLDCDIVCVPSRSEALSTAALEAMLCGVPVVASRTGGLLTMVEDGVTGYLANPDDPKSLARAILKASSSREGLAAMGQRGLEKVQREFTWSGVAAQLQEMLDDEFATGAAPVRVQSHG